MNQIEKYVDIARTFPNKGGELLRIVTTQKRMVEGLVRAKQPEEIKQLLSLVAEGHDVVINLLEYIHTTLKEVANDSTTLAEGARTREIIETQAEEILRLWEKIK